MELSGTLVTYLETAPDTTMGQPVMCLPGSIHIPAGTVDVDLEHAGDPIGTVTDLDHDDNQIVISVAVDQVPAGVVGFSPYLDIRAGYLNPAGDTYLVEVAVLSRVALTARPAFPSSLIWTT